MTNHELNVAIAKKLFPGKPIVENGKEVWCADKGVDFRKPHLSERMLHELENIRIDKATDGWVCNTHYAKQMSKAIALAYVGESDMRTSKELIEEQDANPQPIPTHGNFRMFDRFGCITQDRCIENWIPAAEFRDLALHARRKAAELIATADEMDAWLQEHTS